jgi:RNA polymerase sigma factor (sigma-70 family)
MMKIPSPDAALLQASVNGDLVAIDVLLRAIEPAVYNLAVRMLGQRDDAADATQEILLKVVTHLSGFRGDAAFSTWVFQVARNHLLTASTRARESPEVSLDALAERLQAGLDFGAAQPEAGRALTPEDKLAARQVALSCTQGMLMTLDREHRLVFVLDLLFGLSSKDGAAVAGVSAEAYRQRLSRARARLDAFAQRSCGLANPDAACHCERQLPALRHAATQGGLPTPSVVAVHPVEHDEAARALDGLQRMSDSIGLLRAHPQYRAPQALLGAIRAVLRAEGYVGPAPPLQ